MDHKSEKQLFKESYTGMFDADKYYEYLQDCKKIDRDYKDATYNKNYNEQLVKEAKQESFNKHLRNG